MALYRMLTLLMLKNSDVKDNTVRYSIMELLFGFFSACLGFVFFYFLLYINNLDKKSPYAV